MNTEIFKVHVQKPVHFLATNELNWFLQIFLGSLERSAVCNISILNSFF